MLVRVVAPHFVAGLVFARDHEEPYVHVCTEAAPILRWCIGRNAPELRTYFVGKGWKASRLG